MSTRNDDRFAPTDSHSRTKALIDNVNSTAVNTKHFKKDVGSEKVRSDKKGFNSTWMSGLGEKRVGVKGNP